MTKDCAKTPGMELWPKCKCGHRLGFVYYAAIRVGKEHCSACGYSKEVDWIEKALLQGMRRSQEGRKE